MSQGQRVEYLEKALELDPAHREALDELANIRRPGEITTAPEPPSARANPKQKAPPAQLKLAPLSKRFIAIVIDGFIVGIFSFAVLFAGGPFAALNQAMASADLDAINAAMAQFQSDALPVNLLVSAVYNVVLDEAVQRPDPGQDGLRHTRRSRRTAGASAFWTRCCATCWDI